MAKNQIVYEEISEITANYKNPRSDDYLNYQMKVVIKASGKIPVQVELKFHGMYPFAAPMPPEEHAIKATNIPDLYSKLARWFKKYAYMMA